ncbi:MAG: tRNA adenosine(34) deaminase TadA [Bacillota bacterium]
MKNQQGFDVYGMGLALEEARKAYSLGEVPVGAVILKEGTVIGKGHNLKETLNDPTAHAEILAIREAARYETGWRILNATMYVTLEPCPMCAGAIVMARIPRLIVGTRDPRAGACGSLWDITGDQRLNHRVEVSFGVMEEKCRVLLESFFKELREGRV